MTWLLTFLVLLVYGYTSLFIYVLVKKNTILQVKLIMCLVLIALGTLTQGYAIMILDYRGDVIWIFEPLLGFYRILNKEILLLQFLRIDFGITLPDFVQNYILQNDILRFMIKYSIFTPFIMIINRNGKESRINVLFMWSAKFFIDLIVSLVFGWGYHDFIAFYYPYPTDDFPGGFRIIGDVKDIVLYGAALCYILCKSIEPNRQVKEKTGTT